NSWRPGCGPDPSCHTPGKAPDMASSDDEGPLTEDELRHQAIQDRLMAELRKVEEELGHRVDLLSTGEWITCTTTTRPRHLLPPMPGATSGASAVVRIRWGPNLPPRPGTKTAGPTWSGPAEVTNLSPDDPGHAQQSERCDSTHR